MQQETPDEFIGGQSHRFDLAAGPVVLPLERDLIVSHIEQAVVRDGYAMGIAAHIVEDLLRPGEWTLGVDHPLGSFRSLEVPDNGEAFVKRLQRAEEPQFAGVKSFLQGFQKQTSEQTGQHADWQDPLRSSQRLALWAMPVPATVETIPLMATLIASLEMATEGRRSTQFDCGHDAPLRRRHRRAMLFSVGFAVTAEHIRYFELRAIHGPLFRSAEGWQLWT
jgi:hypothetical protein